MSNSGINNQRRMLDKAKHIKISKSVHTKDDLDFDFLRSTGIDYIESMGGGLWTDMNVHDPGITFLETLCYAITDLANRINLPIESLIASESDLNLKNQFYQAHQILPSAPTTAADYRKLFSDIPGVRNSWMVPYEHALHLDYARSVIAYSPSKFIDPSTPQQRTMMLRGLNRVIVDYDLTALKPNGELVTIAWINAEIRRMYYANRNLCEDLVDIIPVKEHPIGVCLTIELDPNVDEDYVHAQVLLAIEKYFSPEIEHHSLKEMLERGYRTDEIYEGPFLKNGFIDDAELKAADLRREVRLSDLVNVIMDIKGIKLIQEITIKDCKQNKDGTGWVICIDPYTKPVLCPTEKPKGKEDKKCCTLSSFSYYKNVLPVTVNKKKVQQFKDDFADARRARIALAALDRTLSVRRGTIVDAQDTTTVQNTLPETYGVSPFGLPPNAGLKRRSQALQLKGYLTFFDQILVSYFAHLSKVKDLLSINTGVVPTYFTQAIKDIKDFDKIVRDYPTTDDELLSEKLLGSLDNNIERRNEILDHLLARFAETFSEYTFLMHELYGKASDEMVLFSKEQFLKEYVDFSSTRGTAYNVYGEVWNTANVAGAQKRIARLSGMSNYHRRNLSNPLVSVYKTTTGEYRWWIKSPPNTKILSSSGGFATSSIATKEMYRCVFELVNTRIDRVEAAFENGVVHGSQIDNIVIYRRTDGKYKFNVIDPEVPQGQGFDIIGLHSHYYADLSVLKTKIIETINYLKSGFNEEGMFLIEHVFLLPTLTNLEAELDEFLPVCVEDGQDCCSMDPYSFRVSVVLPGYTQRYSDPDFRNYLELLIQRELPAHVVPRICWIGHRVGQEGEGELNELVTLERAYQTFLRSVKKKKVDNIEIPKQVMMDFKDILFDLHSLHPSGRLHDCESEDDLEGKIILGRTNLGTL